MAALSMILSDQFQGHPTVQMRINSQTVHAMANNMKSCGFLSNSCVRTC